MARPRKKGLDYFPHDVDAMNDEKIESLMFLYGAKGYLFYFGLLERIYRTNNQELDVSASETIQILGKKLGINSEEWDKMLASAINFGCFDGDAYKDRQVLTSNGIKNRAGVVIEKRLKMRDKYHKQVSTSETPQETPPETRQSKVKESKVKESKVVVVGDSFLDDIEPDGQLIDVSKVTDTLIAQWDSFAKHKAIGHRNIVQIEVSRLMLSNGFDVVDISLGISNYHEALSCPNSQAHDFQMARWLSKNFMESYIDGKFDIKNYDKSNFEKPNEPKRTRGVR